MDQHVNENLERLRSLLSLLRWASGSLLAAVVLWVIVVLSAPALG